MTNLIALRTVTEFLSDYTPSYNPIMPLFMDNAKQYPVEVGQADFKRASAVGDLRGRVITPKDTEIFQIGAASNLKSFKKYFFGAQFIQSDLQSREGYENVVAEVLDEHNKQNDELFLLGDGTAANNVLNNGLYWSADPNYLLNASDAIAAGTDGTHLLDLYATMVSLIETANATDGRKLVLVYGSTMIQKFNGLFAASDTPFSKVIGDALSEISFAKMPASITPGGANGMIIVNIPKTKLHYTLLPTVKGQGVNEEKMYAWTNFLMGSSMLEVLAPGAVTRQPFTFA